MIDTRTSNLLLFLFGLFALLQVKLIGSIGISEIVVYLLAPFVFIGNIRLLRHDGFMPIIYLSFMVMTGCTLSSWHNNTPLPLFARGFAQIYSLFAFPVVFHKLIRDNLRGVRWLLLGMCISMVVNVFVFRQSYEVSMLAGGLNNDDTTRLIMNGPLFWLNRVGNFLVWPMEGWYFQTPMPFTLFSVVAMAIFSMVTSDSGRSATAYAIAAAGVICMGGKSIRRMRKLQNHFWTLAIGGLCLAVLLKAGYNFLAKNQLLNEKAQHKYERQFKQGGGLVQILVGGRSETFAGLLACFDEPIWGFGPWSYDEKGYYINFVAKYGTAEDYDDFHKRYEQARMMGFLPSMPSHSHIIGFWIRYGILGLTYWLYIVYCMYRHFRRNMAAIPQWFGMMTLWLVSNCWHVIFSPYGRRVNDMLFVTCLLLCDAVRRGRIPLPYEMQSEAMQHP